MTSLRSGVKLTPMKKLSLYVFLVLMWCNVGFAECIEGDCYNGHGTSTYADGENKYLGEFKDGAMHGQGTFTGANGNKYIGEFEDSYMHGQGKYIYANGDIYVGEYVANERNGQGTHIYANGDIYAGEYFWNERTGEGTYTFADGSIKSGLWFKDELITNADEIEEIKWKINYNKAIFRDVVNHSCPTCFWNDAE